MPPSPKKTSTPRRDLNLPGWEYLRAEERLEAILQNDFINPLRLCTRSLMELYHTDTLLVHRLMSQTDKYINTGEIPLSLRVFAALHYFANGRYQPELRRIFRDKEMENVLMVANAIKKLKQLHVKFPNIGDFGTDGENYPSIGVVDRYQIRIKDPRLLHKREKYLNSDGYYSISLQLISHLSLKILQAECSHGGITLGKHYPEDEPQDQHPFVLTDPRYELHPSVILPYMKVLEPGQEQIKKYQAMAGEYSKNMISTFKQIFPCLSLLKVSPENAETIIEACVVLHNMMFDRGLIKEILKPQPALHRYLLGPNTKLRKRKHESTKKKKPQPQPKPKGKPKAKPNRYSN